MADNDDTKKRLGDFEIIRELGRGGMGVVYEARQVSLNRKVALKVISGSLGLSSKAVLRFQREAEAAGKLHHTNIVPIYSTGDDDGAHYYAMELIDGPSLHEVVRSLRSGDRKSSKVSGSAATMVVGTEQPVSTSVLLEDAGSGAVETPAWVSEILGSPPLTDDSTPAPSSASQPSSSNYFDTVATMIAGVADGLDYAHDNGVIHRDIKPANLLLSKDGRVSINDFGLARMLEQPGMTMSGEFVGSPLYMSPEQITAGRVPLDHRTDIFSLGSTLYELLTLAPPFPGRGRDEVMARILQKDPRRPRTINKKVPLDLETICLKTLEKDPDLRYQSAGQLAEDLRRFINRFEITARRAGPVRRVVKWARRRPAVAGLLVCLVLAIALAYGWHRSEIATRAARAEGELQSALIKAFNTQLGEVEPHLEQAEAFGGDAGRIHLLRGYTAWAQGQHDAAIPELKQALQEMPDSVAVNALLARLLKGDESYEAAARAMVLKPKGLVDYLLGATAVAPFQPRKAISWLEMAVKDSPSPGVFILLAKTRTFVLQDSYESSEIGETLRYANLARDSLGTPGVKGLCAWAHLLAADIYRVNGDPRHKSEFAIAKASAAELEQEHGETIHSHSVNAAVAIYERDWEKALNYFQRGEALHPETQALLLHVLGRYPEGLDLIANLPSREQEFWAVARAIFTAELKGPGEARASYHEWLENDSPAPRGNGFRSVAYEIFSLLGSPDDAVQLSRDYIARLNPRRLSAGIPFRDTLERFVQGHATEKELLESADSHRHRVVTRYLLGLRRLARGDRAGAIEQFEINERSCRFLRPPESWTLALLERLRDDPTWPPWIPVKDSAEGARK